MHNTGNPIGSKDILDLYDNSETIDNFVNSQQDEVPDRFGTKRLTLAGLIKRSMALRNEISDFSGALTFKPEWSDVPMNVSEGVGGEGGALNLQAEALGNRSEINKVTSREALRRSYAEAGYNLVDGSFEAGGTVSAVTDVLIYEAEGKAYSWNAGLPKTVTAGSTPTGSGGISQSAWSTQKSNAGTIILRDYLTGTADETLAVMRAVDIANGRPILMTGEVIQVSTLALTRNAYFTGEGSITKISGTTGHLISSTAKLKMRGDILLDHNAANCPQPSPTATNACAVYHTGTVLDLEGLTFADSVSANIRTTATKRLRLVDNDVTGGWFCVLAHVGTACRVTVRDGHYRNATKDDNIQIHNSQRFDVTNVTSSGSFRSGIVISSAAQRGTIANNVCYDNKIAVATNQGGWGIVLSVSVADVTVSGNICYNNQRGPMTIDTFTSGGGDTATDARIAVTGGLLDGDYNGVYCTTGLGINGARFVSVTGVRIRRATQHILAVSSKVVELNGNTHEDCGGGYFIQANTCDDVQINGGIMTGCINASQAVVQAFNCNRFRCSGTDISGLSGSGRHVFRIDNTADWTIDSNVVHKTDAGSGHILFLTNSVSKGRVFGNKFKSQTAAFQYFYHGIGAGITDVVSENNEVAIPGITYNPVRYIYQNASVWAATTAYALNAYVYANNRVYRADTAGTSGSTPPSHTSGTASDGTVVWMYIGEQITYGGGDTLNGVKDYFPSAPTYCRFKQGQTAGIAGLLKMWNGTAWV